MKRFTHRNEGFTCAACGQEVPPLRGSCRNHCPFCLVSRHVDVTPGDRANHCQGLMDLVDYEQTGHKGLMLEFCCRKCGERTRNRAATEADLAPDDLDRILAVRPQQP